MSYFVANDNGDIIAHDIQDFEKAVLICEIANEDDPGKNYEVMEG